ncbi:cytochrome P450 2J1-like isoform X1 [Lytechinus variegatus]|uniref:cytochrome P450 2J1-like isoform X1 n=2 Tax=Lytechinus variegatus TaxID=7654 RepID=UPI001BB2B4D3|nr:cytochrome P450 2J1-like isoform X1 [Lytechinus variegatus]
MAKELFSNMAEYLPDSAIFTVLSAFLLCYFIYYIITSRRQVRHPPGPIGLPFLGSVFALSFTKKRQYEVINDWTKKYGSVFSFKLLNTRVYVVSDFRMARDILASTHVTAKLPFPVLKTLHGTHNAGIAFCSGEVWQEQRRLFVSFLKNATLGGVRFEKLVEEQAQRVLLEMEKMDKKSFDPRYMIHAALNNVVLRIMTGVNYDHGDPEFILFMKLSSRLFSLLGPGGLLAVLPVLAAGTSKTGQDLTETWKDILIFLKKRIAEHKINFDPNQETTDFMHLYLQEMARRESQNDQRSFNDTNMLASTFDGVIGGTDPTVLNILWILHTFACYPEAQRRVRREISEVIGNDNFPRFSDRLRMPLTMSTITECRRFRPVVDILIPHVATKDCKIGEYDVTKGGVVTVNLFHFSKSPDLWDKPEEFQPDRFLTETGEFDMKKEPLFFGIGRRVCPGEQLARMNIFIFITHILKRFAISLPEGAPMDLPALHGLTTNPDHFEIHAVKIDDD